MYIIILERPLATVFIMLLKLERHKSVQKKTLTLAKTCIALPVELQKLLMTRMHWNMDQNVHLPHPRISFFCLILIQVNVEM